MFKNVRSPRMLFLSVWEILLAEMIRNISFKKKKKRLHFLFFSFEQISDILKVHCMQQTEVDTSTPGGLSSSTVDELCSMIKTISTREHADEVADTMIEKMSHLHIVHNEQVQKNMKQTYKPHFIL